MTQNRRRLRAAALAAALIGLASQAQAAMSGNQGRQLAASCASCHDANPGDRAIPSLAGLTELQINQAMTSFRSGTREGPIMHIVASALSPEEIAAVAHYLSSPRAKEKSR
jgi:cytochrome c553